VKREHFHCAWLCFLTNYQDWEHHKKNDQERDYLPAGWELSTLTFIPTEPEHSIVFLASHLAWVDYPEYD